MERLQQNINGIKQKFIIPNVEINDELHIKNLRDNKSIYIKDTFRNFLKPDCENIYTHIKDDDEIVVIVLFKSAWSIDAERLSKISLKYNIDFKIYAFEMGMEFNQDVEIIKGKIIKDEEITYTNYLWECIDPISGGQIKMILYEEEDN